MTIHIITLGTGSGKPTPLRNVSSTALQRDGEMILFDCGETTQMQMLRAQLKPSRLKVICITHMHGDHINGLPGLLGSLSLNRHTDPLTVIGPKGIREYLTVLKRHHVFFPSYPLTIKEIPVEGGEVFKGKNYTISALALKHRIPTFGYRWVEHDKPGRFDLDAARALEIPPGPLFGELQRGKAITLEDGTVISPEQVLGETRSGVVVAYCTDTSSPCANVLKLGANADLMIHEGTYADTFEQMARQRGHSTVTQAATAAKKANVKRLLITHISPKYSDFREMLSSARQIFPNSFMAKDLNVYEL